MLGRSTFSAALVALAVPVALAAGPAQAAPGPDDGGPGDSPATVGPRSTAGLQRPVELSRQAKRARAAAEDETPLTVTIDDVTPSTMPRRGPISVSGTVTNNDTVTRTTINVYALVSETPMTTAAELEAAAQSDPAEFAGERITDEAYKDTIAELAPGQSQPFSFSVSRGALDVSAPGVYLFGVHALSDDPEGGRDDLADGRARTFLPLVPADDGSLVDGQVDTAIVIPLRRELVYADDGSLDDLAGWTSTLSPDGRLRSLVEFGAGSGSRPVTWVVDPALVDTVRRLAEGNPPRSLDANLAQGDDDGEPDSAESPTTPSEPPADDKTQAEPADDNGSPLDLDELDPVVQAASRAAQVWLDRLGAAMTDDDEVLTLPYGDVDVPGAAEHDPALLQRAFDRSAAGLAGFDVRTAPVVVSPSGFLSADGLAAVPEGTTVLMSEAMFLPGERLLEEGALPTPAPSAAVVDGHRVLVTSSGAADGGPGPDDRTGLAAMRQRLLAEAAVRLLDPNAPPLTVVAPHDWNPSASASTYFAGLEPEWLDLSTVSGAAASTAAEPVDGTTLRYPTWQAETELTEPSFAAADELMRSGTALQSLLTLNNVIGATVADQALASASYSARTRPLANRSATDRSRDWIESRLAEVEVRPPPVVTLSSSSGRFGATIINRLDQPVTVALDAESDADLTVSGPRRVDIQPRSRTTVLLTAATDENGVHRVRLLVTDKRGVPLGEGTVLSIRSAQVSKVIWLFIGVGAALLFLAIGLRLFRRIRDARRSPAPADPPADPSDAPADKQPAGAGTR